MCSRETNNYKEYEEYTNSLSTRLIKPNFCFHVSHRRSTTVFFLETRNPFTTQLLRPRSFLATTTLKLTMSNLKTLTKELRQEIVSYLYPLPSISINFAFRLTSLIPLIYSQIHVTIFPPMAKLFYTLI